MTHFNEIIEQTVDYKLQIYENPEDPRKSLYSVINKSFNIIEMETPILPLALKTLRDLQGMLDSIRDFNGENELPKAIVPSNKLN